MCIWPVLLGLAAWTAPGEPRLYIQSTTVKADYVEIIYEINNPGFVELHLTGPKGNKVWIKGKVSERAESDRIVDYIRIPKAPLEAGQRYSYVLRYKGQEYASSFYVQ
ncbi:MAG: hypothetical protein OHK0039_47320 [Bacteroidia bacterium]